MQTGRRSFEEFVRGGAAIVRRSQAGSSTRGEKRSVESCTAVSLRGSAASRGHGSSATAKRWRIEPRKSRHKECNRLDKRSPRGVRAGVGAAVDRDRVPPIGGGMRDARIGGVDRG